MTKDFPTEEMRPGKEDSSSGSESESDLTAQESYKESEISYTRDFILPFAELHICKELPSEFDRSKLLAFDDACYGVLQRQRTPVDASLPGSRGSEQNSSQYNHDSEFTRHYSNQHQRCWQDGPGSGSFPGGPGCTTGASAPWDRGTGHCLLNQSDAPYRPPRPYQALLHSGRENYDSHDDETFGSTNCFGEERQEKEMREASFALMRKEQQKATYEKHIQIPDMHDLDDASLLEDSRNHKRLVDKNNESKESVPPPVSNKEFVAAASGPLFPAGFMSRVSVKNFDTKVSTNPTILKENLVRKSYRKNPTSNNAHSYAEEEKISSGGAISSVVKCGSQVHKVSNGRSTGQDHLNISSDRNELVDKPVISPKTSVTDGISEKSYSFYDPIDTSEVSTFENQQSVLSDSCRNSSSQHQFMQGWSVYDTEKEQPENYEDDKSATQHGFSFIEKGNIVKNLKCSSELYMGSSDNTIFSDIQSASSVTNSSSKGNIRKSKKKKSPPPREIFGSCIVPELRSNEASVSIRRRSVGKITENHDLKPYGVSPLVGENDDMFLLTVDRCRSIGTVGERFSSTFDTCRSIETIGEGILVSNHAKQTELVDTGEHGLDFKEGWEDQINFEEGQINIEEGGEDAITEEAAAGEEPLSDAVVAEEVGMVDEEIEDQLALPPPPQPICEVCGKQFALAIEVRYHQRIYYRRIRIWSTIGGTSGIGKRSATKESYPFLISCTK